MGEEVEREGLWDDDQSWEFPKLATVEEDCGIKSADSDGQVAVKDNGSPPTPPEKGKKRSAAAGGESELHILTERERRKKMRDMFSNLHALLPHIPPKADKSTIVDEAVKYIKRVEQSVLELEKRKQSLMTQNQDLKTWNCGNVVLNVCGADAHISVCSIRKPGLLAALCFTMERNNLEVVSAQVSSCIYIIHARPAYGGSDQFQQAFAIEENFKQAAAEITMWLNS
uniref:Basic helix-loop-helix transcription factor n=1 Tax=Salvia miltiorrhiza TaxID=226208 RepID=A0A0H3YBU1_SALMI|nr:basic helix-loop-helix transcription factor [Salvia miltiorrhiza]